MKSEILSFRDLEVWQSAMDLAVDCYKLTEQFPSSERFGLTAQLRRSSCSIPSNFAEGHNRKATKIFLHHVSLARGSEAELDTQIELAVRLEFCTNESVRGLQEQRAAIGRMLSGLASSLKRRVLAEAAAKVSVSSAVLLSVWWGVSVSMPLLW
jgi:four helix bundle protein